MDSILMKITNKILILFITLLCSINLHANNWDTLFDLSDYQDAKISPDGKHLAVQVIHESQAALLFFDRVTMKAVGSAIIGGSYEVGDYSWINNERVVMKIVKRVPWFELPQFYGELFAVNFDGSKRKLIYGYQSGEMQTGSAIKKKQSTLGWGDIIDTLPEDKKHILISSTPMSNTGEELASALLLNVYTGIIKKKLLKSPVPFARFLTDTNGEIKAVIGTNQDNSNQVFLRKNDEWEKISTDLMGDSVRLVSISESGKYLYTLDNKNQDMTGLFKLNLEDYSYKHVYIDKKVDVTDVELTTDKRSAFALRIDDGYPAYLILNKKVAEGKIFKSILNIFPYSSVNITSRTKNGRFYIIYVSSDVNPGSLYIFDNKQQTISLLFNFKTKVDTKELVKTEPVEVEARDGTKISGYFTPAKNFDKDSPAPVVVLVHGGPHKARDYWGYSSQKQFLALNGYSVFQVNYRGSGGYGQKFETAGYQAWGSLIQQDIFDAYQWLIAQKKATKNNACIMGGSFGAYSAIQSVAIYPDTYKCAIANAGIYDLTLMFEEGDIQTRKSGISYLTTVLGNDQKQLTNMSPVNYVEKIMVPILLAHGEEDERAPFEHATRLRKALDNAEKPYEWFVVDKEGHGFYNPKNQQAYMNKVLAFLGQNLK